MPELIVEQLWLDDHASTQSVIASMRDFAHRRLHQALNLSFASAILIIMCVPFVLLLRTWRMHSKSSRSHKKSLQRRLLKCSS